ncbi:MAG TPA: ankyrin repeat domain-containing protein [Nitrospirota bacterium]|nr:ankyrin repeat domain-containing protein [Nitrospirota bacterium]
MKKLFSCFAILALLITLAGCRSQLANAIVQNDIAAVRTLISGGAEVNEKSPDNFSPLHWAAEHGRTEIARLLIERGADVNCRSESYGTPLMVASYRGNRDTVKLLLEKGADPAATDTYGKTALNYAQEYQLSEIVRILTEAAPAPLPAATVAPAGDQGTAGVPVPAKAAPSSMAKEYSRQINMAIFTFESINAEANQYSAEIANRLENRLENIPFIKLIGRRDLEKFLVNNDLQQNNALENIIRIGTMLGVHYIISGRVEKKGAEIIADTQLISIEEQGSTLNRVIQAAGDANLAQEVDKFSVSVTEVLSQLP